MTAVAGRQARTGEVVTAVTVSIVREVVDVGEDEVCSLSTVILRHLTAFQVILARNLAVALPLLHEAPRFPKSVQ